MPLFQRKRREVTRGGKGLRAAEPIDRSHVEACALASLLPEARADLRGRDKARFVYLYTRMTRLYFVKIEDEIVGYFELADEPILRLEGKGYGRRYSSLYLHFFDRPPADGLGDFVAMLVELTARGGKDAGNLLFSPRNPGDFEDRLLAALLAAGFERVDKAAVPERVYARADRLSARFGFENGYRTNDHYVLARG